MSSSKGRLSSSMNPVYSHVQPAAPYGNPAKNMAYTGEPLGGGSYGAELTSLCFSAYTLWHRNGVLQE
ncbi:hypothetical protein Z043_121693 [Scleropages formosus]|uniref:Uncharacterized protein n=1 Tax=Scleropages formosus TaxID=113540 RepID=A0A0P7THH3_SCLFO|nr:hypothetical protein Z043_121693 [Scleropages formosus]